MAGRFFLSLGRTKVRDFVRDASVEIRSLQRGYNARQWRQPVFFACSHQRRARIAHPLGVCTGGQCGAIQQPLHVGIHGAGRRDVAIGDVKKCGTCDACRHTCEVLSHRRARQHDQRENQFIHLQSPILRNCRHHRVRLLDCHHPGPADGPNAWPPDAIPGGAWRSALCALPQTLFPSAGGIEPVPSVFGGGS